MQIMDSFMDKIKSTFGMAADKSKDAIKFANMKSAVWMMEKQKSQQLQKLGEVVFQQYRTKSKNTEEITSLCHEIDRTDREIQKTKDKIEGKSEVEIEVAETPMDKPNVRRCKCGTPIVPGNLFCTLCGSKVIK
jgi:hypothetical protein